MARASLCAMIHRGDPWLASCAAVLFAACHGAPAPVSDANTLDPARIVVETPSAGPAAPALAARAPAIDLPAGWKSAGREAFERLLETSLPSNVPHSFTSTALSELTQALQGADESAVRAVAWLARADDARASELLLGRLEQRRSLSAEANGPASAIDVAAAAALDPSATTRDVAARLEALVAGKKSHPALDVRVECARVALHAGRDGVIVFLLSVLRTGTTLIGARLDATAVQSATELDWCQTRAAQALALRAGLPPRFRSAAPLAERERALQELEAALVPRRADKTP